MNASNPIALLKAIEANARALASNLPAQQEIVQTWSGIGFRIGKNYFVSPMAEVVELLNIPSVTRLPNVKPWVMGVANVRGRLIPIVDLCQFIGISSAVPTSERRVLIIDQNDQLQGLVVDGVLGMQYFAADSLRPEVPQLPATLAPFIAGHYSRDDRTWSQFSMARLGHHQDFMAVAC